MKDTLVEYMYRDAANFRFYGKFVVSGKFGMEDISRYLFDNEFFVPHEVGLEHLLDLPMNQNDHFLHSFTSFTSIHGSEPKCGADELVERFKTADEKGWFSSFDR